MARIGDMKAGFLGTFDPVVAEDDLLDLFLLALTEYVLGSYWSSFSDIATAMNGSTRPKILKLRAA